MKNKNQLFLSTIASIIAILLCVGSQSLTFSQGTGVMGVIGTATVNNDWVNAIDMNQEEGNPDLWTLNMTLTDGEVYFINDNSWDSVWGGTTFPSGTGVFLSGAIVVIAGDYLVSFNTSSLAYNFQTTILDTLDGNIGIGTSSPQEKLDVDGNIRFSGELMPDGASGAAGQVLQSTGNGNMQWAEASASQGTVGYGTWGDCEMQNITEYNPVCDPDGEEDDAFGYAVAMSSDYAIIGAPYDSSSGGYQQGSVIMYHHDQNTGIWVQDGDKLFNPGAYTEDAFGYSVDIDSNYAIIGTPYDFAATWDWGSASIIKRNETTGIWEFQGSKLVNENPAVDDQFGYSVSISGDYAIVGAPGDDVGTGSSSIHGSASVYKRNPSNGNWELQGSKLRDSDPYAIDQFGYSVSISGDYAIVGTPHDYQSTNLGSASIFKRNPSSQEWEFQPPKLWNQSAQGGDWFGCSVSISGDYAIVGAMGDEEGAGILQGSATVFRRDTITGEWKMVGAKLLNVNPETGQRFGWYVSLSGDYAIVAAILEAGEYGAYQGSATIFMKVGHPWYRLQKIFDPAGNNEDYFGQSCDIDGNTRRFVIGAPGASGNYGKAVFGKY